jgi:hypothetical protein
LSWLHASVVAACTGIAAAVALIAHVSCLQLSYAGWLEKSAAAAELCRLLTIRMLHVAPAKRSYALYNCTRRMLGMGWLIWLHNDVTLITMMMVTKFLPEKVV